MTAFTASVLPTLGLLVFTASIELQYLLCVYCSLARSWIALEECAIFYFGDCLNVSFIFSPREDILHRYHGRACSQEVEGTRSTRHSLRVGKNGMNY